MLSNSYCRTWLGHALGKLQGARAKHDTGHEGWASLVWQSLALGWCCPEPGACAGVPRVCVCVCRTSPPAGTHPHIPVLCPPVLPFPERSSQSWVGISLFSPKSCHHVAKDYQYLVCSQTARDPKPEPDLPVYVCTAKLLLLWRETALHRGEAGALWRCCWGGSARTLLRRACTFSCKQKFL